MKKTCLTIIILVLAVGIVYADNSVPPLINYQGMLTDSTGQPLSGTKKLAFSIYDAAIGGNLIWGPQIFDGVPLFNGRFNVILGTTDTAGRSITTAFSSNNRFLGITVDSGQELSPRQQILSAPYAIQAERAANAANADNAAFAEKVGALPPSDYDSGWFYIEPGKNYDKNHNLGILPRLAVVWAASDSSGSNMYLMDSVYEPANGFGSWLQRITTNSYRLSTGQGSAMSAYGIDRHWNWDNGTGYIRVFMWK